MIKLYVWLGYPEVVEKLSLSVSVADRTHYDWIRDCSEPACGWVGSDPGVRHHAEASLGPWAHGYEESGQQLLPQLSHASALHHPRLPGKVSTSQLVCLLLSLSFIVTWDFIPTYGETLSFLYIESGWNTQTPKLQTTVLIPITYTFCRPSLFFFFKKKCELTDCMNIWKWITIFNSLPKCSAVKSKSLIKPPVCASVLSVF